MTQPVLSEPPYSPGQPAPSAPRRPHRRFSLLSLTIWLIVLAGIFVLLRSAFHGGPTESGGISTVAVAKADHEDLAEDLWLTAEFVPFLDVSLHAKVAGFLKSISVDVGDEVKVGQKIAELEIPEMEDDVAHAESAYQASLQDVKKAEADSAQAEITYQRLLGVSKEHPKLVAQQDLDEAKAKDDAMKGALGAARQQVEVRQSDVKRTNALRDYSSITVPFGGIITRRYADPGALIQAGISSNTQAMPLVDLAEQDKLRLIFPVPESVTPLVHLDAPVDITVSALNETFRGKISRFAGKVERATRTMHTEVDVLNPDKRYTPGMYAYVRLILHEEKNALAVPVQALLTGDHPSVLLIRNDGTVEERAVQTGLKTPEKVQILKGLEAGDMVITGNRKGVRAGQKVAAKLAELPSDN